MQKCPFYYEEEEKEEEEEEVLPAEDGENVRGLHKGRVVVPKSK